jgi:hypothetical protein
MRALQLPAACLVTLALLLSATATAGCGSSATTSPADAKAVAVAEHEFFVANRRANIAARAQCSKESGQAGESCFQKVVESLEAKPRAEFVTFVEGLLEGGVGPECAEALDEALSTISSVPLFPGGTASICRSESGD